MGTDILIIGTHASQADIGSSDLQIDQMPNDPLEHLDTDEDGIGNNADTDDDGDGVSDDEDVALLDASVAGFFVSGRVTIDGEITLDSDINNSSNPFFKNNVDGNYDPNTEIAQKLIIRLRYMATLISLGLACPARRLRVVTRTIFL